jgi:hypothetical protein
LGDFSLLFQSWIFPYVVATVESTGWATLLRRRDERPMIRKLSSGEYRLYSRKKNPKTGKRRNLGTFKTRAAAEKHERAVQFFKRQG